MADGDPIIIGQANTASNPGNETSLSRNEATDGTVFFAHNQNVGDGIHAEASSGTAVLGRSTDSIGVVGRSTNSFGVVGRTTNLDGVIGTSQSGVGVSASSATSTGAVGHSTRGDGVIGQTEGFNPDPEGHPELSRQIGVIGLSDARFGAGVSGFSPSNVGVRGTSGTPFGPPQRRRSGGHQRQR